MQRHKQLARRQWPLCWPSMVISKRATASIEGRIYPHPDRPLHNCRLTCRPRQADGVRLDTAPPKHPSTEVLGVLLGRDAGLRSDEEGGLPGRGNFSPGAYFSARSREACVLGVQSTVKEELGAAVTVCFGALSASHA